MGADPRGTGIFHASQLLRRAQRAPGSRAGGDGDGVPRQPGLRAPGQHRRAVQGVRGRRHGEGHLQGLVVLGPAGRVEHQGLDPHRHHGLQRRLGRHPTGRRRVGHDRPWCGRLDLGQPNLDRRAQEVAVQRQQRSLGVRLLPVDQRQHRLPLPRHPGRGHGLEQLLAEAGDGQRDLHRPEVRGHVLRPAGHERRDLHRHHPHDHRQRRPGPDRHGHLHGQPRMDDRRPERLQPHLPGAAELGRLLRQAAEHDGRRLQDRLRPLGLRPVRARHHHAHRSP